MTETTLTRNQDIDPAMVQRFLDQPRIGVVGVRRDPRQFANSVYRHLRSGGRSLIPIHPEATDLEGDPCIRSVGDLPEDVRAVLVMVNADAAAHIVEEAVERGIEMVWLHRGAGTGAVSQAAVDRCHQAGVDVIAGACPMMFAEPVGWFHRLHRGIARRRFTPSSA